MWAYLADVQDAATTTPRRSSARVRVDYPVAVDRVLGLGELPTLRLQRRARAAGRRIARAARRCSCGRTGSGSPSRTATVAYMLLRHRERFPRAAALTYAVVRPRRRSCYWAVPTAPPWYAAAAGPARSDGRTPRAAADDGRVRRAVLEGRLGPALQCAGRQSPGRHALAALRHIRDGRAPARRGRAGRGRARLDLRADARASRSCTSASTTSSTCSPGSR